MRDREARGDAAEQRVGDQRRRLLARRPDQLAEPAREGHVVEAGHGIGLPQTGNVGDDDAVALGEAADRGRPIRSAAFDPAVEQDERRAFATFQHRGADSGQADPSFRDRCPGEQTLSKALRCARPGHEATLRGGDRRRFGQNTQPRATADVGDSV